MIAHLGPAIRAVLFVSVAVPWSLGCRDSTPETETCFDEARKAGDTVESEGWQNTDEFRRFANTVTQQGAIFGVPFGVEYSDFLERSYQPIVGISPYRNPEAGEAYRRTFTGCSTPTAEGDSEDLFAEPPSDLEPIILCVARAVQSVEQRYGVGAVGYSMTFEDFAYENTPRDESLNYTSAEATYTAITGRSPLVSVDATQAFIETARSCPDPP